MSGGQQVAIGAIRSRLRMTQAQLADATGIPVPTLRSWEQLRRKPTGAAKVLLTLLARRPELVAELAEAK